MGVRQALAAFVGSLLISFAAVAAETPSIGAEPLPRAKPEDVGMSSERLARSGAALKEDINRGLTRGGNHWLTSRPRNLPCANMVNQTFSACSEEVQKALPGASSDRISNGSSTV
jgi:hypothetical protein